ncbi:hypothetical protein [uncultured Roseovarius sp.]|uniref:hypothetical protein n=1 Tax=uncultured Roseovarius sp. TaxID=293344 RepID=UPI0025D0C574|nr:hypothetical protein [uncultured Roseovarius sp.]
MPVHSIGENLTAQYEGYAIYLPSLQRGYANLPYSDVASVRDGNLPQGCNLADLDFLNPNNNLWHCKYVLYSAGQFEKATLPATDMVARRSKDTVVLGDSGGFQIGMGSLKAVSDLQKYSKQPNAVYHQWLARRSVRDNILRWLDTNSDYAMTLDMPLWVHTNPQAKSSPFINLNTEQLIELSVENLRYFADNRGKATGAKAKYLNVLQDAGNGTGEAWYHAVKDFDFEGWAFGGDTKSGLDPILKWIRRLLDDQKLDHAEWLHILMLSPAEHAVYCTAIQKQLRRLLGTEITVSYDSSSPFQTAGKYEKICQMPALTSDIKTWRIPSMPFPQHPKYKKQDDVRYLEDIQSPISKRFSINDLHVERGLFAQTFFDKLSACLLTNHNIYVYHRAAIIACNQVFADNADWDKLPTRIRENLNKIQAVLS